MLSFKKFLLEIAELDKNFKGSSDVTVYFNQQQKAEYQKMLRRDVIKSLQSILPLNKQEVEAAIGFILGNNTNPRTITYSSNSVDYYIGKAINLALQINSLTPLRASFIYAYCEKALDYSVDLEEKKIEKQEEYERYAKNMLSTSAVTEKLKKLPKYKKDLLYFISLKDKTRIAIHLDKLSDIYPDLYNKLLLHLKDLYKKDLDNLQIAELIIKNPEEFVDYFNKYLQYEFINK